MYRLDLTDSPTREIRNRCGMTLKEFGAKLDLNYQTVYLNECAVYESPVERVVQAGVSIGRFNLAWDYKKFQFAQRAKLGEHFQFYRLGLSALSTPEVNPVYALRTRLELSRLAFCKALCVHPATVARVENNKSHILGTQLSNALLDAGLSLDLVGEMSYRLNDLTTQGN